MQDFMGELIGFLEDGREEVRLSAATTVAGLTGSVDGIKMLLTKSQSLFPVLLKMLHDQSDKVAEQVYATLVNLSLDEAACKILLGFGVVERVMEILRNSRANEAGGGGRNVSLTAKLLSNLTLHEDAVDKLLQKGKGPLEGFFVTWIVQATVCADVETQNEKEYFAAVLTNISQDEVGRRVLFDSDSANLKVLNGELGKKNQSALRRESLCKVVRNVFMGCSKDDKVEEVVESGSIDTCVGLLSSCVGKKEEEQELSVLCRQALLEGVLCLAGEEKSRSVLWKQKVPDILQKLYEQETNEQLNEILERCADVFIEESGM